MPNVTHTASPDITIRTARAEDRMELARVAARDTHALPAGPLLVAQVGSDVRAAISLEDGAIIADPFHRTAELVEMLKIRSAAGREDDYGRTRRGGRSRMRPLAIGRAAGSAAWRPPARAAGGRPASGSPRPRRGGGQASCTARP